MCIFQQGRHWDGLCVFIPRGLSFPLLPPGLAVCKATSYISSRNSVFDVTAFLPQRLPLRLWKSLVLFASPRWEIAPLALTPGPGHALLQWLLAVLLNATLSASSTLSTDANTQRRGSRLLRSLAQCVKETVTRRLQICQRRNHLKFSVGDGPRTLLRFFPVFSFLPLPLPSAAQLLGPYHRLRMTHPVVSTQSLRCWLCGWTVPPKLPRLQRPRNLARRFQACFGVYHTDMSLSE